MATGTRCECCAARSSVVYPRLTKVETPTGAQQRRAQLCDECAEAGHGRDRCQVMEGGQLCGAFVWHCARVAHVAAAHAETLVKYERAKVAADAKRKPNPIKRLGRLWLPG